MSSMRIASIDAPRGAGTPRELEGMVHGGRFATTRIWMVDTATLGVVATFTP